MPAIITHYLFGKEVLKQMDFEPAYPSLFDWGTQGPDFLFFTLSPTADGRRLAAVGQSMHRTDVEKNLSLMADCCECADGDRKAALLSYFYGFLSHYILDSTFHPYVYGMQDYFKTLLPAASGNYLHRKIETNLDVIFLQKLLGETIKTFQPAEKLLIGPELGDICSLYSELLYKNYRKVIPAKRFRKAFSQMKLTYRILYSPGGTRRKMIAAAERLFGQRYQAIAALSHTPENTGEIDYTNLNRAIRADGSNALGYTAFELFDLAKARYLKAAGQAADIMKNSGSMREITGGINFEGDAVSDKFAL